MPSPLPLSIVAKGERVTVITRSFRAPAHKVFAAHTEPEMLRLWLHGPPGWKMSTCEIDFRVGGSYLHEWSKEGQDSVSNGGVFREIDEPKRLVASEQFYKPAYPGEAVNTTTFTEVGDLTTMTLVSEYPSREIRDRALQMGMEQGLVPSYISLDELLEAWPD